MKLDLLALAPHPDDVELHCGGLMLKMATQGYMTGIIDFSRGEMGTRGTVADRNKEAATAAELLHTAIRMNLDLPDSQIGWEQAHKLKVIEAIRRHPADLLLIPHETARHPDHHHTSLVARDAAFLAGLEKIETDQPAFRPKQVLYYYTHYTYRDISPSFIVDISAYFDQKIDTVKAFATQFHNPLSTEPETFISSPGFLKELEAQNRYYGSLIGVEYGEPYIIREYLVIDDPVAYFK